MCRSIIAEGKTSTEAIEKGLKELNVSKNMVDIKVLENEDKRSFFNILNPRVVKVEIKLKENIKDKNVTKKEYEKTEVSQEDLDKAKSNVKNFLEKFLNAIDKNKFSYKIEIEDGQVVVNIEGEGSGLLIGYRGEALNSLQQILNIVSNKDIETKIKVLVDIEGYRNKRKQILEELAVKISRTVIKTGKEIKLEPMVAYERKIIHSKLQENDKITTYSVGEEPNRRIVISKK